MRSRRLTLIEVGAHLSFHHRIMIVVGRVILLSYQPWRWGDLNGRPGHVHVLTRNPAVGHHGIIDYILGERVITDGGIMWQVTLMSLVL